MELNSAPKSFVSTWGCRYCGALIANVATSFKTHAEALADCKRIEVEHLENECKREREFPYPLKLQCKYL